MSVTLSEPLPRRIPPSSHILSSSFAPEQQGGMFEISFHSGSSLALCFAPVSRQYGVDGL